MTASQDELIKWYDQLLEEVLEMVDHVGKGRTKAGGIPSSSAKLIRILIEKTVDVNIITEKTIGNYYRGGYSDSRSFIGIFAAVALVKIYKELSIEDCKKHYEVNKPSSTYYWNQYIEGARKRITPEPTPVYTPGSAKWESQAVSMDLLNIFPSPDYQYVNHRTEPIEKLYDKICRHRVVVVDGIAGSGKKHLAKAIEPVLIERAKYNRIWWVPLHKKYKLEHFLDEIPVEMDAPVKSLSAKLAWLEELLKSNRILIVFYDIEQGELDSFLPLLQRAFDKPGDCRFMVLRNNMSLFPEIPPVNKFTVAPYTEEEIKALIETESIRFSKEQLSTLVKTSGSWPFYIYIVKHKANDQKMLEKIIKDSTTLNEYLIRWFNLWEKNLDDNDQRLIQILFNYNKPISHQDLTTIAKTVGLEQPDVQIGSLGNSHLLIKNLHGLYSLTPAGAQFAAVKPKNSTTAIIHSAIAEMIRTTLPAEPSFDFSGEELNQWLRVIAHQQEAGLFEQSGPVIDKIKRTLKRRNKYPLLIKILNKQINKVNEKKNWFQYDLAHAYYITGEYDKCLLALDDCLDIAKKWYPQNTRDADGVAFFVKTVQLFAELCSATGHIIDAISIFSNALSLFHYTEMNWTNRCHTITVLSEFYERNRNPAKSLEMNENLIEGNYGHSNLAMAVIMMRTALALRRLSRHREARIKLALANKYFIICKDQRGTAWSKSILALYYFDDRNFGLAKKMIKQTISVHVEGSLANEDYRRWLTYLKIKVELADLIPLIDSELDRTSKTHSHAGQTWFAQLGKRINELSKWLRPRSGAFDLESFIKPLRGNNDFPPNSEITRSLEKRIRRQPFIFLEEIAKLDPVQMFQDSHFNSQVKLCATIFECQEFIKKQIIQKNYGLLCDQQLIPDDIRMKYSQILYSMCEYVQALDLLEHIATENRKFNFVMLKADCLVRRGIFDEADSIYELALEAPPSQKKHAMILYKRSKLIIEARYTVKFEEALEWSREALDLNNTEEDFVHHVENTIVYLTIEITQQEALELQMQKLITIYSLSPSRLDGIVQSISNITKRNMLKRIIPLYAV